MPLLDFRPARHDEVPALQRLIVASARVLGRAFYDEAANEAAIARLYGVDSALIADGTYLIATLDGALAGCGGWSGRETMFGGDQWGDRQGRLLDPRHNPARIRAFFVAPDFARRGVASALLARCEAAAVAAGFSAATLLATLSGEPFYAARGYLTGERIDVDIGENRLAFVSMSKQLLPNGNSANQYRIVEDSTCQ